MKLNALVLYTTIALSVLSYPINAEENPHQHHMMAMQMDKSGMVMNENKDKLPKDCPKISEDVTIKVTTGTRFAEKYAGTVFGLDQHQWQVKPCSRVTVEFTNKDEIRHQWMIHGLPKYLYPQGMFHIELNGSGTKTGTFIVPNSHFTYLVHCDIAQHMEKGMKAQLKVGKGRGDLPSIPGISDPTFKDNW
ncbi:MAG: multicopper oxidase domain-containing protein [Methylococcales bacterium]|nr:multicopper oxidase domain-containing protein [Methylococcales bacterium]